jgi:hypothetical protein
MNGGVLKDAVAGGTEVGLEPIHDVLSRDGNTLWKAAGYDPGLSSLGSDNRAVRSKDSEVVLATTMIQMSCKMLTESFERTWWYT